MTAPTERPSVRPRRAVGFSRVLASIPLALALGGCGGADDSGSGEPTSVSSDATINRVVNVDGERGLYLRCSGSGSPTLVLEGGDEDTSDSYAFAERRLAAVTRTCVYDRANLGGSDPAPGPRGFTDLVEDLEHLLAKAAVREPYVLVGTSGGGYIVAGYAFAHPAQIAGMAFIEVPAPFRAPPRAIVEETKWNHPSNIERRDYLQIEKDAWAARKQVGDIPVTIVSNAYSNAEIAGAAFPSERKGMRTNVQDQRGWLVLSPRARQIIVHTGHAVEEADPELVIDVILDVVKAAKSR
jgi:pimeloyl-ACP methyl ester carboxylesterase